VDGVVFLVDAIDRERFPEAKKELDVSNNEHDRLGVGTLHRGVPGKSAEHLWRSHKICMLHLQALLTCDELANVPFLVLGNKIDIARAVSEEELRYALGLQNTYGKEVSAYCVFDSIQRATVFSGPPAPRVSRAYSKDRERSQQASGLSSCTCALSSSVWVMPMVGG
jgi:hypothetical protein